MLLIATYMFRVNDHLREVREKAIPNLLYVSNKSISPKRFFYSFNNALIYKMTER